MKKLNILIYSLVVVMFGSWFFCDMLKTVPIPFLTYFGMVHWIPEIILLFCVAYDLGDKLPKQTIHTITIAIFLLPLLYYTIVGQTFIYIIFGFGAGCLFSGLFLYGYIRGHNAKKRVDTSDPPRYR